MLVKNINEYPIHNSTEEGDLVVQETDGEFIVAKLSRQKASAWMEIKNGDKYET